jgi:hypothetical protein
MLIFNGGVQLLELADSSIALSGPKAIRFEGLSKADREILFRLVDGLSDNDPSVELPRFGGRI